MFGGGQGSGEERGVFSGQMPLRLLEVLDQPFAATGAQRRGGRFDPVPGHRSRCPQAFLGFEADPGHVAEGLTEHGRSLVKQGLDRNRTPTSLILGS